MNPDAKFEDYGYGITNRNSQITNGPMIVQ